MPVAEYTDVENAVCKPFLKWPGGKRQLLCDLLERFPKKYKRFLEPWVEEKNFGKHLLKSLFF